MVPRRRKPFASLAPTVVFAVALSACTDPPAPAPAHTRPPPVVATSAVATPTTSTPSPSASSRAIAAPVAPHPVWAMLDGAPDILPHDSKWLKGQPELHLADPGQSSVTQEVDLARVPPDAAKLIGTKIAGYSANDLAAPPCTGTITGLLAYTSDYSQIDSRSLLPLFHATPQSKRASEPKLSAEAWRILRQVGGYRSLVADVALDPGCSIGPTWVAPASAPAPELATFDAVPPALESSVKAALRALPVYDRIQKHYEKRRTKSEPANWWDIPDYMESYEIARLSDGRAIVAAAARLCRGYAEFTMNLEVFFTLTPAGALVSIEPAKPSEARWAVGVGDIDHNGEVDVLTMDGFMLSKGGRFDEQVYTRGPIYTCPGDSAAAGAFNPP